MIPGYRYMYHMIHYTLQSILDRRNKIYGDFLEVSAKILNFDRHATRNHTSVIHIHVDVPHPHLAYI